MMTNTKTYPEINGMNRRDLMEAIKLGTMNMDSVKPEYQEELRSRLAAMRERLRRLDATEQFIDSVTRLLHRRRGGCR